MIYSLHKINFLEDDIYNYKTIDILNKIFQNYNYGILNGFDVLKFSNTNLKLFNGLILYKYIEDNENQYILLELKDDIIININNIKVINYDKTIKHPIEKDGLYYLIFEYYINPNQTSNNYTGEIFFIERNDLNNYIGNYIILQNVEIHNNQLYLVNGISDNIFWESPSRFKNIEDTRQLLEKLRINENETLLDLIYYKHLNDIENMKSYYDNLENQEFLENYTDEDVNDKIYHKNYVLQQMNSIFEQTKIQKTQMDVDENHFLLFDQQQQLINYMNDLPKYKDQGITYKNIDIFNNTGKHILFSSNQLSNNNLLLLDNKPFIPYELQIERTVAIDNANLSSGILNYEISLNRKIDDNFDKQIIISKNKLDLENWQSDFDLSGFIDNNELTDLFYISDIKSVEHKKIEISLDVKQDIPNLVTHTQNIQYLSNHKINQQGTSDMYLQYGNNNRLSHYDSQNNIFENKLTLFHNKQRQDMTKINDEIIIQGGDNNISNTNIYVYNTLMESQRVQRTRYPIQVKENKIQKYKNEINANTNIISVGGINQQTNRYINSVYKISQNNNMSELIITQLPEFESELNKFDIISDSINTFLIQLDNENTFINIYKLDQINNRWILRNKFSYSNYGILSESSLQNKIDTNLYKSYEVNLIKTHDNIINGNIYFTTFYKTFKYNINSNTLTTLFVDTISLETIYSYFVMGDNNKDQLFLQGFGNYIKKIKIVNTDIKELNFINLLFKLKLQWVNQPDKYFV